MLGAPGTQWRGQDDAAAYAGGTARPGGRYDRASWQAAGNNRAPRRCTSARPAAAGRQRRVPGDRARLRARRPPSAPFALAMGKRGRRAHRARRAGGRRYGGDPQGGRGDRFPPGARGGRRRVALAALLAQQPRLFLLDEPSSHLDLSHQLTLLERLAAAVRRDDKALIMVVHDVNLAVRYCDHALLLADGEAVAGSAQELLTAERLSAVYRVSLRQGRGPRGNLFAPD